jgi:alpha-beta hydrolase superfamily lysophospholipase
MRSLIKHALLFTGYGALGVVITLVAVYVAAQQRRPELQPWHLSVLDAEYSVERDTAIEDIDGYLQLETRLFAQLSEDVYPNTPPQHRRPLNRYFTGSLADPRSQATDWNRTTEQRHPQARGAVLLLHGLSDSPYVMSHISNLLYGQGFSVLSLRLPGHGTVPSGLLYVNHKDWMAAVRMGMRHLSQTTKDGQPVYIVGFSTGAALAVEYSLSRLLGEQSPTPAGLVLLSPAIGVSPLAAFASWQLRLASLPGMEKLAWTDILPEYDPYKYNSFTVNAGDQIYQLTQRIASQLDQLGAETGVPGVPPILAFQSVADATVSPPAVLNALFLHLAPEGHELVAFDINRSADVTPLLGKDVLELRPRLLDGPAMPVDFTLIVNADPETSRVVEVRRPALSTSAMTRELDLAWPQGVYALSHVALPVPGNDPVYGRQRQPGSRMIFLGQADLRGERGLLSISADSLLRLRHNPFMPYVEERILDFVNSDNSQAASKPGASETP